MNHNKRAIDQALRQVAEMVEERLKLFFYDIESRPPTNVFDTRVRSILLDQIRDLTLRAGKRLRAALLVYGASLFDTEAKKRPAVIDAAAALEMIQTYFLIHDDIMDDDEIRRGGLAVHVALAEKTGSLQEGQGLGILAGDLAAALEQILLTSMDIDAARRMEVARIFAAMHLDVVHGQTLDMLGNSPAFEIAAHKTASYTTIGPLTAGAALGGAPSHEIRHLASIALPLGVAFQFRDDLLGTFGDSSVTGKPATSDLLMGKRTILVEVALRLADKRQRAILESVLGKEDATDEMLEEARHVLEECGAREACQARITKLVGEFTAGLDRSHYRNEGREFLLKIAQFVGERTR